MKRFALAPLLALVLSCGFCLAQSVVVTPKKVFYRRPKPPFEGKRTFTVVRPRVSGLTAALNRKVESALRYETISDLNIGEEVNEFNWLEEAIYAVNYNKNGILDVTLTISGVGAYPSSYDKNVVVNLKTGDRVLPADVFVNLEALAAEVRKAQLAEIKKASEQYKKNPDAADFDAGEYFGEANFTAKDLAEFSVGDGGITFIYDYGFPHAALALQPEGKFFFGWAELKSFIKPSGLLGRFVR